MDTLVNRKFLVPWDALASNDSCEICEMGGRLVLCSYCNLAWHIHCARDEGEIQAETKSALEDENGDWACRRCYEGGVKLFRGRSRRQRTRRLEPKRRNTKRTKTEHRCETCDFGLSQKNCSRCFRFVCTNCAPEMARVKAKHSIFCTRRDCRGPLDDSSSDSASEIMDEDGGS